MIESIYDFYLKKSTFLFFAILAIISWLSWGITILLTDNPVKLFVFALIFCALTCGMLISYIKGETNVQKMFFGSLLLFFIVDFVELVDLYIALKMVFYAVISGIILTLLVVFFVCHFLQQLDHVGRGIIHVINQCCGLLIILCVIFLANCVVNGTVTANDYTFLIAVMATLSLIICMETRISKYKQMRFEYKKKGEWNEDNRLKAKKIFKL